MLNDIAGRDEMLLLLIGAAVFVLVAMLAVIHELRSRKKESPTGLDYDYQKKRTMRHFATALYRVIDGIPFVRLPMQRVLRRYRAIYPGETIEPVMRSIRDMAVCAVIILAGYGGLTDLVPWVAKSIDADMFAGLSEPYLYVSSLVIVWVLLKIYLFSRNRNLEKKFLDGFTFFLTDFRHYYSMYKDVRKALQAVSSGSELIMRGHAEKIYEVVDAADPHDMLIGYMLKDYHPQLKLLTEMCISVSDGGDAPDERHGSVFMSALESIKQSVEAERLESTLKALSYRIKLLCCVAVLMVMPYYVCWAVSITPTIAILYHGHYGSVMSLACMVLCICGVRGLEKTRPDAEKKSYGLFKVFEDVFPFSLFTAVLKLMRGRERTARFREKLRKSGATYSVETFDVIRILLCITAAGTVAVMLIVGCANERRLLRTDVSTFADELPNCSKRQIEVLKEVIPEYVERYDAAGVMPDADEVRSLLTAVPQLNRKLAVEDAVSLILARTEKCLALKGFTVLDAVIAIAAGILAFFYPNLSMAVTDYMAEDRKRAEVMSFQHIIHATKRLPGAKSFTILALLEEFADVFRPAISECLVNFYADGNEALRKLRDSEEYVPFRHLVDGFLQVDELGIDRAFDEISADIESSEESRRVNENIKIGRMREIADVFAYTPPLLIGTAYMLAPFVIHAANLFDMSALSGII